MAKPDPKFGEMCYNGSSMRRIALLFLLAAFSFSFSYSPEEIVARVEKAVSSLQTLQANFEQSYYSAYMTTPLKEKGKFYFKKPDRMKWEYTEPEKKVFFYSEGILLSYFPEDNQLIRNSLPDDAHESEILGLFSGSLKIAENYIVEPSPFPSEKKSSPQLKLTPKEEGEFSYILLEINDETWLIERAVFFDWAGNKQEFRFGQIKTDGRIPPSHFELKVPEGCEIIEENVPAKRDFGRRQQRPS